MREQKEIVSKENTLDMLEIRLGRIVKVEEVDLLKKSYYLKIDFGKFGMKTSVGRFTKQSVEEMVGKQVLAILNFPEREVGGIQSEVLVLGVQYPKAESGEATFLTPFKEAKIGGKVF